MRGPLLIRVLILAAILLTPSSTRAGKYFDESDRNGVRAYPVEGHAVVYIFRPGSRAEGIRTWVFVDEQLLMVSKDRAYSMIVIPEGEHLFWSKAENTSALALDLEAGKTYYLKLATGTGFNMPRARLTVVDEAQANEYFDQCRYVRTTRKGKTRAAEIVANRMGRARTKVSRRKKQQD